MPIINDNELGASIRTKFNNNGTVKNNYSATTNPTTGDDTGDGYEVGSKWINTSSNEEFVCLDASSGSAVWSSTTAQGAGGSGLDSSAAIALLQPNIDSNATDIEALRSADTTLQTNIDSNATDIEALRSADTTLQTNIDSNATDISTLSSRIDSNYTEINNLIPLNNWSATTNPGSSNDNTQGYQVGSSWINVTADEEFICVDASTGSAVWSSTTDQSAGGSGLDSSAALSLIQPRIDSNATDISTLNSRVDSNSTAIANLTGGGLDSAATIALLQPNIDSNATDIEALRSADTTLQTNIDSNANDIEALRSADTTLQTNIDSNATDIEALRSADTTLQTNIDSNATDISNEITARTNADTTLQTNIDSNATDIEALRSADTTLQTNIDSNASDIEALRSADTTLQTNIDSNATDISNEITARINADSNLQAQIDSNETYMKGIAAAGGDAWGDAVDANIVPDGDGTRNLGSVSNKFGILHVDSINLNGISLGGAGVADPNADAFFMWNDSDSNMEFNTLGTGITRSGSVINAEVSLTNTATLTNKTLDSAVINNPDINLGTIDSSTISNPVINSPDINLGTIDSSTVSNPAVQYTTYNAGTQSSGTYTPSVSDGNMQKIINGGAHTLAPPTVDTTIVVQYTNNSSAGTITTSGFTIVTGDSLTTTDGDDFLAYIAVVNSFSHLNVVALQ